jgi:hypothetical protein
MFKDYLNNQCAELYSQEIATLAQKKGYWPSSERQRTLFPKWEYWTQEESKIRYIKIGESEVISDNFGVLGRRFYYTS